MTRARHSQIDLTATSFYHVINRCVRRSYLCGDDKVSGKNFDHRRQWLVERFTMLSDVFSINIAAYAVMSNHYHLVLQVDKVAADTWTMDEVIERWYRLFNGHLLVDRYLTEETISPSHLEAVEKLVALWRARLYDISWYMKCLNEHIARQANKEDKCTGRFWEGRFKSQALLDDIALLSCMAYVDLNPIRAGVAPNLSESHFTSIQKRIAQYKSHQKQITKNNSDISVPEQPKTLLPFSGTDNTQAIPFSYSDYFELVDWSSRHVDPNKSSYVDSGEPQILTTLGIDEDDWLTAVKHFRRQYGSFAGTTEHLRDFAHHHGRSWCKHPS
ncbi:MAG: transposase [Gammaproteobacteria bacterium]|nr:transposase [Gammaproteobacteria bacterium]